MEDRVNGNYTGIKFGQILALSGLFSLVATMFFGDASSIFSLIISIVIIILELTFGFFRNSVYLPYIALISSPVTLFYYSSTPDFQFRLLALIFFAYIFSIPLISRNFNEKISEFIPKPFQIWFIPFLIFVTLSIWLNYRGIQLSGDEPHYLMVTQSIVDDGDILLKNNVENKTYLEYIPVEIPAHMIIRNGKHLSFHMPGLSFLLTPFWLIFKLTKNIIDPHLFFRISASFINAFFPFVLFYLMKFFFPKEKVNGVWLISLMSVPVLFHSVHLFPELPASTLLAGSFLLIFKEKSMPVTSGLLFSLTIWFHVKYYPPLFIFAVFVAWKLIKERRKTDLSRFLIFPIISSVILLIFIKIFYGTLNPTAIFPAENYWTTPLLLKIKVFLAYFLDQRDGLFLYAPLLFLSLFGLKRGFKKWNILPVILLIYTLFHSITTVRGAHSPVGRPLIFVLWILLLLTFKNYYESHKKYLFKVLAGLNFFILFWILMNPQFVYQPVFSATTTRSSSILGFLGSNTVNLSGMFPSFITNPKSFYFPNIIWIFVLSVLIVLFYTRAGFKFSISRNNYKIVSATLFLSFTFLVSIFPHVHIETKNRFHKNGISFFNSSANFVWIDSSKSFRIKNGEEYNLYFEERKWKKNLLFDFEISRDSHVTVKNGKQTLFRSGSEANGSFKINLSKLHRLRILKKDLIPIWIKTESSEGDRFIYLKVSAK